MIRKRYIALAVGVVVATVIVKPLLVQMGVPAAVVDKGVEKGIKMGKELILYVPPLVASTVLKQPPVPSPDIIKGTAYIIGCLI